jgi:hypothetical protein
MRLTMMLSDGFSALDVVGEDLWTFEVGLTAYVPFILLR